VRFFGTILDTLFIRGAHARLIPSAHGMYRSSMTAPPTARYALNLLVDGTDRLLLLRRSPQARLGPDQWGLPAGKIEPGESAPAAALREMQEEIGAGHGVELLRYLGPIRDTYYGGQFEIHLFLRRWHHGRVLLNNEHTEFAWVSRESFREYAVMDGIDEDIALLDLWPQRFLNTARVPPGLRRI
jgi:8-oxo-dGTP pyrophosphatase MutT (NUDIX family)